MRDAATRELGVTPRSFRAVRWGYGDTFSKPLLDLGFDIELATHDLLAALECLQGLAAIAIFMAGAHQQAPGRFTERVLFNQAFG